MAIQRMWIDLINLCHVIHRQAARGEEREHPTIPPDRYFGRVVHSSSHVDVLIVDGSFQNKTSTVYVPPQKSHQFKRSVIVTGPANRKHFETYAKSHIRLTARTFSLSFAHFPY